MPELKEGDIVWIRCGSDNYRNSMPSRPIKIKVSNPNFGENKFIGFPVVKRYSKIMYWYGKSEIFNPGDAMIHKCSKCGILFSCSGFCQIGVNREECHCNSNTCDSSPQSYKDKCAVHPVEKNTKFIGGYKVVQT